MVNPKNDRLILVTGASGYVGGRLVPRLLESGYRVRCLARDPARLRTRPWIGQAEIMAGDILRPETLGSVLAGVDTAYYMVHSLVKGTNYEKNDRIAAENFARAAREAGVRRIIYLGQLGQPEPDASPYMRSRHETGDILRDSGIPVTEFRAGVIVGSGSITFEMIRYLTERWPFLTCPLWAYTFGQPIAIRDVLSYLIAALDKPESKDKVIEIGGPDQLTYAEMLLGYSVERGLARWMIPVRLMTPRLSAYWVHLITPISASVARPLIEEMVSNAVLTNSLAQELFPDIQPIPYHRAVRLAIGRIDSGTVETSWSDALVSSLGEEIQPVMLTTTEGFLIEKRQTLVNAPPAEVFRAFTGLGGETGWLFMNWTWRIRGFIDRMTGGVGLRRGRRHPEDVHVGDALDFWRVEALEVNHLMRLRAEMNVPGKAWLEFQIEPQNDGRSLLSQTAFFEPRGLAGFLYWYVLYPIHAVIFSGMIRRLGERALKLAAQESYL